MTVTASPDGVGAWGGSAGDGCVGRGLRVSGAVAGGAGDAGGRSSGWRGLYGGGSGFGFILTFSGFSFAFVFGFGFLVGSVDFC